MRSTPAVTSVEDLGAYRLRVGFSDGVLREIDLSAELWGPMFEPMRDLTIFAQVSLDAELGTIVWPNGADLAPEFLYGDHASNRP